MWREVLLVILDDGDRGGLGGALGTRDLDLHHLAGEVGDEGAFRELVTAETVAVVRIAVGVFGRGVVGRHEALQEFEFVEEAGDDFCNVLENGEWNLSTPKMLH